MKKREKQLDGFRNLQEIKKRITLGYSENFNLHLLEDNQGELFQEEEHISLVIINGKYNLSVHNRTVKLLKGNIMLLKKGNRIRYHGDDKESSIVVINFKKELFSHLAASMADCPIFYDFLRLNPENMEYLIFDIHGYDIVTVYLQLLLYEVSSLKENNQKMVKAALVSFLTKLHDVHKEALIISESSMMKDHDIGVWLKYMTDNYRTVTLSSIASEFNFNPTYFSSRFKTLANCHFSEKLLEIRLEKAKWMLLRSNLSVQEIIELIGFKEKSYFYRVFKKHYGETPLQYRKRSDKLKAK